MILKLLHGVLRLNNKGDMADGGSQVLTVEGEGFPKARQGSQKDLCTNGSESRAPVRTHGKLEPTKHRASYRVTPIE